MSLIISITFFYELKLENYVFHLSFSQKKQQMNCFEPIQSLVWALTAKSKTTSGSLTTAKTELRDGNMILVFIAILWAYNCACTQHLWLGIGFVLAKTITNKHFKLYPMQFEYVRKRNGIGELYCKCMIKVLMLKLWVVICTFWLTQSIHKCFTEQQIILCILSCFNSLKKLVLSTYSTGNLF